MFEPEDFAGYGEFQKQLQIFATRICIKKEILVSYEHYYAIGLSSLFQFKDYTQAIIYLENITSEMCGDDGAIFYFAAQYLKGIACFFIRRPDLAVLFFSQLIVNCSTFYDVQYDLGLAYYYLFLLKGNEPYLASALLSFQEAKRLRAEEAEKNHGEMSLQFPESFNQILASIDISKSQQPALAPQNIPSTSSQRKRREPATKTSAQPLKRKRTAQQFFGFLPPSSNSHKSYNETALTFINYTHTPIQPQTLGKK